MNTPSRKIVSCLLLAATYLVSVSARADYVPSTTTDTPQSLPVEAVLGMGVGGDDPLPQSALIINISRAAGIHSTRISMDKSFWDMDKKVATPEKLDQLILMCHSQGLRPMFLFNYYPAMKCSITDYNWEAIGQQFADRFKPNSAWLKGQGINDWGVTIYTAFNEPDTDSKDGLIPVADYVNALTAFAKGIHASDPALRVVPGGFAGPCAHSDYSCKDYGPAIAPLLNDGTLDGIDLHDYNGTYAPIFQQKFTGQGMFDLVKDKCGITRDINFYCTEFNGTEVGGEKTVLSEEGKNAKVLLTTLWGQLSVTGSGGPSVANLKTMIAMPYSPHGLVSEFAWGLASKTDPWVPTVRGRVVQWVAALAKGMHFTDIKRGSFQLQGNGRKLWVVQNRTGYLDASNPLESIDITDFPPNATDIEVWYAKGLERTLPINGAKTLTIDSLRREETVMILARPKFLGLFSRKTHGQAGTFDIPMNVDGEGPVSTEPRSNADGLTLVYNFADPITSAEIKVVSGNAPSPKLTYPDNSVVVTFAAPPDKQLIKLQLTKIKTASDKMLPDVNATVGLLEGDVDGNGIVETMDADWTTDVISTTTLGQQRARCDIDLSGLVDQADVTAITAHLGDKLPPQP